MNINMEKRFLEAPAEERPRSVFDLSYEHQTSFNVGELIPIGVQEVYPGDTHSVKTSKVVRLQTLLNPIYGTFYLDVRHFFVPCRLVYDHFEEMMGENKESAWIPKKEYVTPVMTVSSPGSKADTTQVPLGSLMDYMGIPVGYTGEWNAIPIRCYHKIFEDWYRDENLEDPENIYTGEATTYISDLDADYYNEYYVWPRKVARLHDYFSSCLPAPQKGPAVALPLGSQAPVYSTNQFVPYYSDPSFTNLTVKGMVGEGYTPDDGFRLLLGPRYDQGESSEVGSVQYGSYIVHSPGVTSSYDFTPLNLWADLESVTGANINDLRLAFQIQRMLERDAMGSRYIELLRNHFGTVSPDARLQRSEYLGGNRIPLNVHQVVNSSESASYQLGNLGALSHTVDINEDFVKSFTEHGFIISLACVRYQNVYAQGLERFWSRSDRYSYYWPTLAHLGNMAVKNREIYALGDESTNDEVFGYQEAWMDLRTRQNRCSSELRPGVDGSLASWNLSDYYEETPVLSDEWIRFDPDVTDRVLAVGHSVSKQIFADFYIEDYAARVMPMYSVPGLIDHF